ncbi:sigma-70 family RNA polymerase sigma factor [Candidatus Falkowbacteria bacterium]|jgi:RNA polymerase sigma-70 factor (ECF subfamily)|nr:sigma-70 family RNA polymerase sigma factor [Candidatus Falkowbacteria bacterium]
MTIKKIAFSASFCFYLLKAEKFVDLIPSFSTFTRLIIQKGSWVLKLAETENIVDLVNRCRKGDKSAQHRLYLNYADAMFAICKRLVVSIEDAEDILQDAFVIAFTRIDNLKDERKFGGWLKTITVNECLNFLKHKKIRFDELPENVAIADETEELPFEPNAEAVNLAIAGLPAGSRIIFNLYLIENYKHKEIADMLKISESTSKSQYQRAKYLLKEKLIPTKDAR